jgi:hypothetical protein
MASGELTKALRAYVAFHPAQGPRLDMMGRTKRAVWADLIEPAWDLGDEALSARTRRREMREFGWQVLPCTVTVDLTTAGRAALKAGGS